MKKKQTLVVDFEHAASDKAESLFVHLTNLLADFERRRTPIKVDVVAYGRGIDHFLAGTPYDDTVARFAESGVVFYVCQNAMTAFGVSKDQLHPRVTVTPSGVAAIAQLQFDGSAYFKA